MPTFDALVGAVNGVFGDFLAREHNPLAIRLAFRHRSRSVALTPQVLADTWPDATGRLAVFIHGLCCDEQSWSLYSSAHWPDAATPQTYGPRLEDALDYTPLYVRYNTGRHISENGEDFAQALEQLVEHWPVPVERIALIGHSMGGLVARSASHHGLASGLRWPAKVTQVICLGSPHHGAPLEKIGNVATAVLGAFDITRPIATTINARSSGIKDLRYGSLRKEDWHELDPDALLGDRREPVLPLPKARYHFIGATMGETPNDPRGLLLGDGLVRPASAAGRHRNPKHQLPVQDGDGHILCQLHHMQLLNHPEVYAHLERWLA